jgi:hypothetical protein
LNCGTVFTSGLDRHGRKKGLDLVPLIFDSRGQIAEERIGYLCNLQGPLLKSSAIRLPCHTQTRFICTEIREMSHMNEPWRGSSTRGNPVMKANCTQESESKIPSFAKPRPNFAAIKPPGVSFQLMKRFFLFHGNLENPTIVFADGIIHHHHPDVMDQPCQKGLPWLQTVESLSQLHGGSGTCNGMEPIHCPIKIRDWTGAQERFKDRTPQCQALDGLKPKDQDGPGKGRYSSGASIVR